MEVLRGVSRGEPGEAGRRSEVGLPLGLEAPEREAESIPGHERLAEELQADLAGRPVLLA